jgi:5-methylcytosine-specific restriction endonuclease McrA
MNKKEYNQYLLSDGWQLKRMFAFSQNGEECVCGEKADEVHHLTYVNLGNEKMTDLLPLCGDCHESYHMIEAKRKKAEKLNTLPAITDGDETEERKRIVLGNFEGVKG